MKSKVLVLASVVLLVFTVACASFSPALWHSMVSAQAYPTDDSGIMIVFYKTADEQYLFWTDLTADIIDNGATWDIHSPQVNVGGLNKALATYDYYQYQPIPFDYSGNITALELQPPTAADLPHSQHIGKLTAVNPALAKPATVTRKWHGMTFDIQCLASQSVVDMWSAGTLNVGDYVIVSFIDEHPSETEVNLAIVVDKVFNSWS